MEIKTVIFWLLLIAMAVPSFYFGYAKLVSQIDKVALFKRLGYSIWFMKLIGLGEVASAIGLFFGPTRVMAIAILTVILSGAVGSHLRVKDPTKEVMAPVLVLLHLAIIFVLTIY